MALRIQTNIAAMTSHRSLAATDSSVSKSLERLSSGYRINRAADDAAGLSISEGFRADVASFKVASRNTTEANALLQVAEGGMEQIGNMLTRLKELATQAASSNVGSAERSKINSEGNALISEIDRIANSTKYGSINLLDGTFGATNSTGTYSGATNKGVYGALTYVYSMAGAATSAEMLNMGLTLTGMTSTMSAGTWTFTAVDGTHVRLGNGSVTETITVAATVTTSTQTLTFANLGLTFTVNCVVESAAFCGSSVNLRDTGLTSLNATGATTGTWAFTTAGTGAITLGNGTVTQTISGISPGTAQDLNFSTLGITFSVGSGYTENDLENITFLVSSSGTGNVFQIGAKNDADNRISLSVTGVGSSTLNSNLVVDSLDTQTEAQSMLTYIDSAISALNTARGTVGASMNRLSYAAANLATTVENVQAADSVIRDVDMAAEMTTFTKNQILLQAGTAMLAQANQAPQLILSLLK